ncbi:hypothetical protein [Burkholderia gladioli]|uniref:hypothetical protein n=1 Tax=Burkholderia gladioli TaxID=28095 RepID=UPI00163E8B79|nr:hypothetical protein [Burkholderia gladioli]
MPNKRESPHVFAERHAAYLEFLNKDYRQAYWLKAYDAPIWECNFSTDPNETIVLPFREHQATDADPEEDDDSERSNSDSKMTIKWSAVLLPDGRPLTHPKHRKLLDNGRSLLCLQTHPDILSVGNVQPIIAKRRVRDAAHIFDGLLLNAEEFGLLDGHGLKALSDVDMENFLTRLASSSVASEQFYSWNQKLSSWLIENGQLVSAKELLALRQIDPDIAELGKADSELFLNEEQLIRARAFLYLNKYYGRGRGQYDYRRVPKPLVLASAIFGRSTICGVYAHHIPEELCYGKRERYTREYPMIPVRDEEISVCSVQTLNRLVNVMDTSFAALSKIGLGIPGSTASVLANKSLIDELPLKSIKRFISLNPRIVLNALKQAIEFFIEHGVEILKSYGNVVLAAHNAKLSCREFCKTNDVKKYLTPHVRRMGVRYWQLDFEMTMYEQNARRKDFVRTPASEYFKRLRKNEGLVELVEVFFGCSQLITGIFSGRRQKELMGLELPGCLDKAFGKLKFIAGKTGGTEISRPVPKLVIRVLSEIERFENQLRTVPAWTSINTPFICPSSRGLPLPHHDDLNACFDSFADYFELPLDSLGRRTYPRQHPLRRFTMLAFFWAFGFNDPYLIQWHLGHVGMRSWYRYVTEWTDGEVLVQIKATFATEGLRRGSPMFRELSTLVKRYFDVNDFRTIASDEIEDCIVNLQHEGRVTIEPHFFDPRNENKVRIVIVVKFDEGVPA